MTLTNLKAEAYDTIANIEALQRRLMELNNAIANFKEEKIGEDPPETGGGSFPPPPIKP